jgi:hypothetical protein
VTPQRSAEAALSQTSSAALDRRYDKKLAIVIPYRDRAAHLRQLLPHLVTYFTRDKLDQQIAVSIHIVEQAAGAPFNRGLIKNCGFALVRDGADYVCFHDVDYLPVWADYSWSAQPARLIWHGLKLKEDWRSFFGGVVLFDRLAFERVNGYSNRYWGWGPEDLELGLRCDITGLGFDRRDGTFMALDHPLAGFTAEGIYTPEAHRTHTLWARRQPLLPELMRIDGLNALNFKLERQTQITIDGSADLPIRHYIVEIGQPPAEHDAE